MGTYKLPEKTRIGHIHLKVSNLQRSLDFYCGLLGFEIISSSGNDVAFISAFGYHHHIGLNVWYSKNGNTPPQNATGLFHTAILYPERRDLAEILKRLRAANYKLSGAADHGVSEALYLDDPDHNGVELYWDRPKSEWPLDSDGNITMYTKPLNLQALLMELEQ